MRKQTSAQESPTHRLVQQPIVAERIRLPGVMSALLYVPIQESDVSRPNERLSR